MSEKSIKQAKKLVQKYQKTIFFHVTDERIDILESRECAYIDLANTISVLKKVANKTPFNSDIEEYVNNKIAEYTAIEEAMKSL